MNIEKILNEYDSMFGQFSLQDIEVFLQKKINEAKMEKDFGSVVTLLNEIIGFCRDTTQKEKALNYCEELKALLDTLEMEGSVAYATSLLNIANAYRAFGLFKQSLDFFEKTYKTYEKQLEKTDFSYASLFNNWGLLYQEMEEYEKARELFLKALAIVDLYKDAIIPQANTRTNLAVTLLQLKSKEHYQEAMEYLGEALAVFEKDGGQDFHYPAALVALGDAYLYQEDFEKAMESYEKGMAEIERHVGRTDNYERVLEKYRYACKFAKKKNENEFILNLERCRTFFEAYGKPMIQEKFPEYVKRIAAGLVGEGSDCFGFDDAISMDHDYGIGFCMWLTDEDYEKIGADLVSGYEKLMEIWGEKSPHDLFLKNRRGVFSINSFYNGILGTDLNYEKGEGPDFYSSEEQQLATAVNGAVFYDELGIFQTVRDRILGYYPEPVYLRRLAQALHEFSQYAQSNFRRMQAREDFITTKLCVAKGIESAMDIAYLLNRKYAPYYKWKKKGLEKLEKLPEILPLLEQIATAKEQEVESLFDEVAGLFLQELKKQGLVKGDDLFLENYVRQILGGDKEKVISRIIESEWKQFDKVKNEGGRADCQDDFNTFSIMRKSQYLTWTKELLESYLDDLCLAEEKGWNLIMEKYARMMKSTCPKRYQELEGELPVLSEERLAIQEEIIKIQVGWMEEFAREFPKIAGTARSIHTEEDNEYNTSYETYLRGELGTYSERTFVLYGRWIATLAQEGKNLACETMRNTVELYGYASLENAERRL